MNDIFLGPLIKTPAISNGQIEAYGFFTSETSALSGWFVYGFTG